MLTGRDGQFVLYNQGWVAEQRRRAEALRRQEAVKKAAGQVQAADQMPAMHADRQCLELARQKL